MKNLDDAERRHCENLAKWKIFCCYALLEFSIKWITHGKRKGYLTHWTDDDE